MTKKTIIHTGLAKTGTSFLQLKIFPYLNDVFAFSNADDPFNNKLFKELFSINNPLSSNIDYQYKLEINDFINNIDESCFLLSSEGFSSSIIDHFKFYYKNTDILKQLFPNAKIFFVYRKQTDWFESYYTQIYFKEKYFNFFVGIEEFLGYKDGEFRENGKYMNVFNPNWLTMVEYYQEKFGKENVLALPYEMFKENQYEFLEKFYNFSGLTPYFPEKNEYKNKTRSNLNLENTFLLNYYLFTVNKLPAKLKSFILKNDRGFQKFLSLFITNMSISAQKLTPEQQSNILEIQMENNQKLSELTGIDLSKYGYFK